MLLFEVLVIKNSTLKYCIKYFTVSEVDFNILQRYFVNLNIISVKQVVVFFLNITCFLFEKSIGISKKIST